MRVYGSSGVGAEVDGRGRLMAQSTIMSPLEYWSQFGKAYSWSFISADIDTGDTLLAVRNDSDKDWLYIDHIAVGGSNVACFYEIHVITAAYTSAGTAVTGVNRNTAFGGVRADATSHADETGNTQGSIIYEIQALAGDTHFIRNPGIVLARDTAVAIDQITESTAGAGCIVGYFAPPPSAL